MLSKLSAAPAIALLATTAQAHKTQADYIIDREIAALTKQTQAALDAVEHEEDAALRAVHEQDIETQRAAAVAEAAAASADRELVQAALASVRENLAIIAAHASGAEAAQAAAVIAEAAAVNAQAGAETAETNAETAETNSAAQLVTAQTAATNAASGASAAQQNQSEAEILQGQADAAATVAATAASDASTSNLAAAASSSAAAGSAGDALTSATNASSSGSDAAQAQTDSEVSSTAATTSATTAGEAQTAAETAESNAAQYSVDSQYLSFNLADSQGISFLEYGDWVEGLRTGSFSLLTSNGVLTAEQPMDILFNGQIMTNAANSAMCQTFDGICHGSAYFKIGDDEYRVLMHKGSVIKVIKDVPLEAESGRPTREVYFCNGTDSCSNYHGPYSKKIQRAERSECPNLGDGTYFNSMYDNGTLVATDPQASFRGDVNTWFDMSNGNFDSSSIDNWCNYINTGTLAAGYTTICSGVDPLEPVCEDSEGALRDTGDDDCCWYYANVSGCGSYDVGGFVAATYCCACM